MPRKTVDTVPPNSPDQPEEPTERATLQIRTNPLGITVSSQGTTTRSLALGVIGPAITITVGYYAGLPVWAIMMICFLQIVAAVVYPLLS